MSKPLGGKGRRIGGDLSVRESQPGGGGAAPGNILADSSSSVSAPLLGKAKTVIIFYKKKYTQNKVSKSAKRRTLHSRECRAATPSPKRPCDSSKEAHFYWLSGAIRPVARHREMRARLMKARAICKVSKNQ